ncbi:MAG TPA: hypoxanthine phosphoribosyltransferase [Nitrospirales bacterium]|jgi:hypoxanthine phosphoribosyltransferase|nr:hypoxanthine phosphoribosyltransferase [Nitrospirales bacterium]
MKPAVEEISGKPIVTQEEMRVRIRELGRQITADYAQKDLILVGILKGAYAFYADLARAIRLPLRVDFLVVSSRAGKAKPAEKVKVLTELTEDIAGRHVLLVEDIVDSGSTVQHIRKTLEVRKPKSIKVCALLNKQARRRVDVAVDYVGFNIPNKFVVGYGLDYQQKYRNLPYLAVLNKVDEEGEPV